MSFKIGDKVRVIKNTIVNEHSFPVGAVGVIEEYWGGEGKPMDVPFPYYLEVNGKTHLYGDEELELYTPAPQFKSTGMTVPFKARYLGTGAEVTVNSVTDTSLGRIYWVSSPEGFQFSLPAAMFVTVE